MSRFLVPPLIAIACAASNTTAAAPPTLQITSIFSNLDGSVQFIRLTETQGLNGQHRLAGLKLTSTHNGVVKEFTFPHDLPTQSTAHRSVLVSVELHVPYTNGGFWSAMYADYSSLPPRFLATDGGVVAFAGVDSVSYGALPSDGEHGLLRDGTITKILLPNTASPLPTPVFAVEYYNPGRDHYFISASAPDLDALDSGRHGGWQRTGLKFPVAALATGFSLDYQPWDPLGFASVPMLPVCRFYLPPESGDSHFLSASASECADVQARFPHFVPETSAAFYVALPDLATGQCPKSDPYTFDMKPVFRLWNGRADTNHRYTTDPAVRSGMIDRGYISEGYGPAGVAFCVPPAF